MILIRNKFSAMTV
jgi:hypothetical protein